jgi:hypothetical protein
MFRPEHTSNETPPRASILARYKACTAHKVFLVSRRSSFSLDNSSQSDDVWTYIMHCLSHATGAD